jgi:acyl-CoA thioesterase FadM
MSRIRIELPDHFSFSINIPIRITDLNYGGHVGNDSFLSIIHEARVAFLQSKGYTEMNLEGIGIIMSDVGIQFKSELFYGDSVTAFVKAGHFSAAGFDLYYKLLNDDKLVAVAKTGMVCYNYDAKKPVRLPQQAIARLQ